MKTTLVVAIFACVLFPQSSRAAEKICFGMGEVKGERFQLMVTEQQAAIRNWKSNRFGKVEGSSIYPFARKLKGRDGKIYFEYAMGKADGSNDLLVDEVLLSAGTEGKVKIRWTGESFIQDAYFCRDER